MGHPIMLTELTDKTIGSQLQPTQSYVTMSKKCYMIRPVY